jgi:hypothetical protein
MMLAKFESNEMFAVFPGDMMDVDVLMCVLVKEEVLKCEREEIEPSLRTIDHQ